MGATESREPWEEMSFCEHDSVIEGTVQKMKLRRLQNMDEATIERVTKFEDEHNFATDTEISADDACVFDSPSPMRLTIGALELHNKSASSQKMIAGVAQIKPAPPNQWKVYLTSDKSKNSSLFVSQAAKLGVDASQVANQKTVLKLNTPDHSVGDISTNVPFQRRIQNGISIEEDNSIARGCASCIDAPFGLLINVLADVVSNEKIKNSSRNQGNK